MNIFSRQHLVGKCRGMITHASPVNHPGGEIGNAAQRRVLIGKNDFGARCGRSFRSREASQATPHHQHIAMHMNVFVSVGIAAFGRVAKAGGFADDGLIDMLPEALRPHERLVVEPAGQEPREFGIDGSHIKRQGWPAVLAHRLQAVEHLNLGGAQIWLMARAIAHTYQCVHFFRAQTHNATRAVIFEAAAKQLGAIGHHRRRQGIACESRQLLAVKTEMHFPGAVDMRAALG